MSYSEFKAKFKEIQELNSISALLSWDMEVKMPSGSDKSFRADQSALISGLVHERSTSDSLLNLINTLESSSSLDHIQQQELKIAKKGILKSKKFTKEFVEKETRITAEAYSIWEEAKKNSDFKQFESALAGIVDLLKEKADLLGYEAHPYNALLDLYEESSTVAQLDPLFTDVEKRLVYLSKR